MPIHGRPAALLTPPNKIIHEPPTTSSRTSSYSISAIIGCFCRHLGLGRGSCPFWRSISVARFVGTKLSFVSPSPPPATSNPKRGSARQPIFIVTHRTSNSVCVRPHDFSAIVSDALLRLPIADRTSKKIFSPFRCQPVLFTPTAHLSSCSFYAFPGFTKKASKREL